MSLNYGTDSWTNIRINFKNSKKPDGKVKVWIDGKIAYDYEGPTNWSKKKIRVITQTNVILNLVFILTQTKKQNINT